MHILYSGFFGAAVKAISGSGFTTGFFALILLIPLVMSIQELRDYLRLKSHGLKVYAYITKCEKHWAGGSGFNWIAPYSYQVNGKSFDGEFMTSYRSPKFEPGKRIEVRCDQSDPQHHITIPHSLRSCMAELFLSGIGFIPLAVYFLIELCKCF